MNRISTVNKKNNRGNIPILVLLLLIGSVFAFNGVLAQKNLGIGTQKENLLEKMQWSDNTRDQAEAFLEQYKSEITGNGFSTENIEMVEDIAQTEYMKSSGGRVGNLSVSMMPSYGQNTTYGNAAINEPIKVWGRVWGGTAPFTYVLDFGDGSSVSGSVTDARSVGQDHTYSSSGSKTATLTITDAVNDVTSRSAVVRVIVNPTHDERVNMAIEKGLIYLYNVQVSNGAEKSYWWSSGDWPSVAGTGAALLAFEENGHLASNDYVEDIYAETVQKGLNQIVTVSGAVKTTLGSGSFYNHSDGIATRSVDENGNGYGAYLSWYTYANAYGALALVLSQSTALDAQNEIIPSGVFAGMSYYELVQDLIEQFGYSQGDGGQRGSWEYYMQYATRRYDGSAQQWPNLVFKAAGDRWGLPTAQWIIDNSTYGFQHLQNANGGVGYDHNATWLNSAKTGGSLVGFANGQKWAVDNDPNVTNALSFIGSVWGQNNPDPGWAYDFYAMYGLKKGLQLQEVETLSTPYGTRDWYQDMSGYLLGNVGMMDGMMPSYRSLGHAFGQYADGHWGGVLHGNTGRLNDLTTAHGILILTKSVTTPLPVAVISPQGDPGYAPFQLDGSNSYHVDQANHSLVEWLWDFDASDGLDWNNPDASGQAPWHQYTQLGTYTITLRVKDDSSPDAVYDMATITLDVTVNNHNPVSVPIPAGQPVYAGKVGDVITLDGTSSYDPDEGPPPPNGYGLNDSIVLYEWDTNGDGVYGDAVGAVVDVTFSIPTSGGVNLRVTDTFGATGISSSYINIYASQNDLSVTSISSANILAGVSADIHVEFANDDSSDGDQLMVPVYFYDGNPFTTGSRLGVGQNFAVNLLIGGTAALDVTALQLNGADSVYVYLDPSDILPEWDETNNIAAVNASNGPPVADAGADQSLDCVVVSGDVTLDGSGSTDPDGDVLSYSWSGPFGTATGVNPTVSLSSTATITLTVDDGNGASSSDDVVVTVVLDETAPVVTLLGDNPLVMNRFNDFVDPSATVDDDCDLNPSLTFTSTVDTSALGSYTVTYTGTDAAGNTASVTRTVEVVNLSPVASASIDQSFSCIVSTVDVTLDGSGSSDPDGDALTYNWTSASFTAALTGVAPTATLGGGTHSVVLTVDDGFGGTATDTMTVSIELDQTAPVITLNDGDTTAVVCLYSYVEPGAVVEDNCDTNPTLVIDASGVDTSLVGFYEVTYTATDESGNVSTAVRIVEVTNQAPVVENEIVGLTISFGDPSLTTTVDLGFVFTDPDAHVMTFTASNGDEGIAAMSFDGSVVTLDAVDLGETVITVTADDGCGGVTEYQFTLTVNVTASLSDAIVFGMDEAELKKDILVNSGNILVNNAYECEDDDHGDDDDDEDDHGDDDEDDDCGDAFELKFDKDVTVAGGYMVKANNIQIKNGTVINSDVYYNFVQDQGNITGDEYSPVDIPLYSTFPPFKSAPAGDNSITVGKSESLTLPPGDYRDIKIKKRGSLYLTGGVYNFRKLNMEEKAKLRIEAATEIRVEKNVKTGEEVYIGPANGSSITAANIIFYVDGDDDDDAAFKLGEESDIYATVWAPNGKVEIKKEVNGTGAFWGEEVKIDKESNLTLDSYFGGTTGNARVMAWVEPGIPTEYTLAQNYPNPFNPETTLEYSILEPGMVSLTVYNILGQEVAALVNEYQPEGFYQVRFDGSRLSSGTYIYVIQTADFRQAKKMVLLK